MLRTLKAVDHYFGEFGGQFIPEILVDPVNEINDLFNQVMSDSVFTNDLLQMLREYAGRPTPLTYAGRFSEFLGHNLQVYLKREDLLHTGAHKLNNALGQCLFAKKLGKKRIIAETGAGQHGVATATACARLGLECIIYMGVVDMVRQAPNVQRMKLLGATVIGVETGTKTLKDAVNAALRDWAASFDHTHYCLGSALGPAPFPEMVATFQAIIGQEVHEQALKALGQRPDAIVACVGGGSNAIGIFAEFIPYDEVALIGVEAGGVGKLAGEHAARFFDKQVGVLHGVKSYVLQDNDGQISETHSISAGLDYPSIAPQHAYLQDSGRAQYSFANDDEALAAMQNLARLEGIIPALESSHALAYVIREKEQLAGQQVVINLSGRGDKDLGQVEQYLSQEDV
ncbi:Tryptophan synthase beta chain [Piscirickettsia salmonis]|uniref:Tryptophan synthase beta chain n=2 Tax=Piscirickettsia salmonis TaxID=1238 RepID=A0A1L6TFE5_PISSA|nr:tryptophan synthase subunit beta [Piscirickettsia salmonis]AKP72316.1 tryptophan synthase subunit beta [Piscirickettsia salmonis LF-89 = ATCC VR-1361]ALB24238.1 tryptophan synthase, beta subunit [Piscirickettsia salmonis]ALY04032.1 tryptophan synthase subunit beta [Piscirickettsia salmonis]AMA43596.1 tryptophan synthase subunit beta [Piscirickettsia salmonis]AOS36065.1 tryptophan synthase subunit beta [Piscirickettsia salmonis]